MRSVRRARTPACVLAASFVFRMYTCPLIAIYIHIHMCIHITHTHSPVLAMHVSFHCHIHTHVHTHTHSPVLDVHVSSISSVSPMVSPLPQTPRPFYATPLDRHSRVLSLPSYTLSYVRYIVNLVLGEQIPLKPCAPCLSLPEPLELYSPLTADPSGPSP